MYTTAVETLALLNGSGGTFSCVIFLALQAREMPVQLT